MKNTQFVDGFYMQLVDFVSQFSYAKDRKVGAVLVKNGVMSYSWNGTVPGSSNETEVDGKTKPEVLHAETQAITKMARSMPTTRATLYCSLSPCIDCAKIIYQMGITRVVFKQLYKDPSGVAFLKQNHILVDQFIPSPTHVYH